MAPSPIVAGGLFGVAAVSRHDAWAVGSHPSGGIGQPLIEHWDGRRWRPVPSPRITISSSLSGIVALSAHDAWAVGSAQVSDAEPARTLIEHWDGTRWQVVPSPNGTLPGYGSALVAVSAASATDIWAVGQQDNYNQDASAPLIEHYVGTGPCRSGTRAGAPATGVSTGSPLVRTTTVGADPVAVAVDARTGRVFVVSQGPRTRNGSPNEHGSVSVLDAATGRLLRTVAVGQRPLAVAVDARTGRAFVANLDSGTVSLLDTASGALLRTVPVTTAPAFPGMTVGSADPSEVVVDERSGRAFVTISDLVSNGYDAISALDARTGTVLYTFPAGQYAHGAALDTRTARLFDLAGNIHYEAINVIDARTGASVRSLPLTEEAPDEIAVDERTSRAFATSADVIGDDIVRVLDARTGRLLHTIQLGKTPTAAAVDAPAGHVFVIDAGPLGGDYQPLGRGSVSLLDATTGAVLRRGLAVGKGYQSAVVDAPAGRVFITNEADRTVSVLDARSGRVVRAVRVGVHPVALAVDARIRRVFVLNQGPLDKNDVPTGPGSVSVLDTSHM